MHYIGICGKVEDVPCGNEGKQTKTNIIFLAEHPVAMLPISRKLLKHREGNTCEETSFPNLFHFLLKSPDILQNVKKASD